MSGIPIDQGPGADMETPVMWAAESELSLEELNKSKHMTRLCKCQNFGNHLGAQIVSLIPVNILQNKKIYM